MSEKRKTSPNLDGITYKAVDDARGVELRALWARAFCRPTTSEHAAKLRQEIKAALRERETASRAAPKAEAPKAAAPKAEAPKAAAPKAEAPKAAAPKAEAPKAAKAVKVATLKAVKADGKLTAKLTARAEAAGLKPGTVLSHVRRGKVLSECVYNAPREWVYRGKTYTSGSAAAAQAAADRGDVATAANGWLYWGLEKRS